MPLDTKRVKVMDLTDVKIYKMSADAGASPTYETGVAIPGVVKLGFKPEMASADLEGDGILLDVFSKVKALEVELEGALLSFEVQAVIMGTTVTEAGATPNQTSTMELTKDTRPNWFKVEGRWQYPGLGLGSVNVTFFKCKVTDPDPIEVNDANGKFGTVKYKAKAIPCESNGKLSSTVANETAAALSE